MSDPDAPEGAQPDAPEGVPPDAPTEGASSEPEIAAPAGDPVAPKKKKKKKALEADAAPIDDPRVREIEVMFAAGDFVRTREIASELIASADPRLADVGRDYLHRIGVDPIQLAFLGACAGALIAIAWIYIPH